MKISYNWLLQFLPAGIFEIPGLDGNLPPGKIAEILTQCGLEVSHLEKYQPVRGGLAGLVIGEVKTKSPHPNADRLSVTTVDIGNSQPLKIVCGAPNVEVGQKVVVATIGSTIYPVSGDEIKIKKSKIRGEESEGMICAENEIGFGTSHAGIMVLSTDAKPGIPAKEYFNLKDDWVFEIDLTPNRVDAASHLGVARDLVAVLLKGTDSHLSVQRPEVNSFMTDNRDMVMEVAIENQEACLRYCGLTISNIEVKESPSWLQSALKTIGQKPINTIVDVTNYVLHELGQPLHAFDADEIVGNKVIVKTLPAGTKFITLDGNERVLHPEDLMICHASDGMCIAGIFGGIKSGVSSKTKNIFLESAYFNPRYIRKTSKRHGLHTESSFRFERGADINSTVHALKRAALLIKELAGGKISSEIIDIYPHPKENNIIEFDYDYCDRLIGKKLDRKMIGKILSLLQIQILESSPEKLLLSVPPFKVDVQRPADVVEEILRIYGYNNIEIPSQVRISVTPSPKPDNNKLQNIISDFLSSNGFTEIMSNSLTRSDYYNSEEWPMDRAVKILNPLSAELDVLRQTLLYNGLETIAYNRNRQSEDLKLYEFGSTYFAASGFREGKYLAMYLAGKRHQDMWNVTNHNNNYYDLKETVENIFKRFGLLKGINRTSIDRDYFSFGLEYKTPNRVPLAEIGKIGTGILQRFDINNEVMYASLNWENIIECAKESEVAYHEIPRFPVVRRDLAMILDKAIRYADIESLAFEIERKLLVEVNLFDIFEDASGIRIPAGNKSYAISFIFRDEQKTLTDIQVGKTMEKLMLAFQEKLGAIIRK